MSNDSENRTKSRFKPAVCFLFVIIGYVCTPVWHITKYCTYICFAGYAGMMISFYLVDMKITLVSSFLLCLAYINGLLFMRVHAIFIDWECFAHVIAYGMLFLFLLMAFTGARKQLTGTWFLSGLPMIIYTLIELTYDRPDLWDISDLKRMFSRLFTFFIFGFLFEIVESVAILVGCLWIKENPYIFNR